jgi:hypothetical protein
MVGYSGTPLKKKLGIKDDGSVFIVNAPEHYFDWISPLPPNVQVTTRLTGELDFVHVFASERKIFESEFLRCKKYLKKDGMLWISWPKKSSKVTTDLDENIIREFGLKNGLVDVKVCAVDEVWSGLKFVYRVKDR